LCFVFVDFVTIIMFFVSKSKFSGDDESLIAKVHGVFAFILMGINIYI